MHFSVAALSVDNKLKSKRNEVVVTYFKVSDQYRLRGNDKDNHTTVSAANLWLGDEPGTSQVSTYNNKHQLQNLSGLCIAVWLLIRRITLLSHVTS